MISSNRSIGANATPLMADIPIEPEEIDYKKMKPTYPGYYLRPEIIESAWYLREATHDPVYRAMGETFYRSLVRYCRTEAAYTSLTDVVSKKQGDSMESFFFAETLKYLYLLLSPDGTIPLDKVGLALMVLGTTAAVVFLVWRPWHRDDRR